MIRSMPWDVGLRALMPRPVPRDRVHPLSRLTGPTHGRGVWLVLSVAGAAAGLAALIPVLVTGDPPLPGYAVINRLAGVSFAVCGLIAWRQRPDSAVGRLLTVTGFGVLLSPVLVQLDSPVALTADALFGDLWIVLFVALFLSFVTGGRLTSTGDVVIVGAFLVDLLVLPFARLLFLPDENNVLLVSPDAGVAGALLKARLALGLVASLAVVLVIATRWRSASRPLRRALLPSLWGAFCAVIYATTLAIFLSGSSIDVLNWPLNAALVTVPAALAWSLLRSRLARGGLAELFRELGTLSRVALRGGGPNGARGSVSRAWHATRRAARGGARQGARRSRRRARVPGAGRALLPRRPGTNRRAARASGRPGGRALRARRPRAGDAHLRPVARRRPRAR